MIWFDLNDLRSILVIIGCLFINISLVYYPYFSIFKDRQKYLPYFIVTAISVYIILGYIFYCFRSLNVYPLTYVVSFALLNIFLLIRNRHNLHLNFKLTIPQIIVFLSLLSIFVYYFFYDALHFITPDNYYDVHNHISFFDSIKTYGQINMPFYAPGFHIIFYSAYLIIGGSNLYRFLGPILGLLIILNLYFVSSIYYTKKSSRILSILLVLFPFFKLLSLQYTMMWPTTTSYLFLPVLIGLLFFNQINSKKQVWLYSICLLSFSLTLPYVLLQYIPVTITVCLLSAIFFRKIKPFFKPKYFLIISLITTFAVTIPAIHVFLQTQIISKVGKFPGIQILKKENDKLIVSNVYQETTVVNLSPTVIPTLSPIPTPLPTITTIPTLAPTIIPTVIPTPIPTIILTPTPPKIFINPKITNNYLLPLIATIKSALTTKTIVPFSPSSLKTYLYLLISLILTIFSIFTKNHKLFILSAFSFLFGLISQFGFFELTQYRGRTGPYIVFLSMITAVYLYDKIKLNHWIFTSIIFLLTLITIFKNKPLIFNREGICPEIFEQVYLIVKKFPNKPFNLIYKYSQVSILSSNIIPYYIDIQDLETSKSRDTFLILQQNYCDQSPKELLEANGHDPTYQYYLKTKADDLQLTQKMTQDIKQSPEFSQFSLYWQNQNISIYFRPKQTN